MEIKTRKLRKDLTGERFGKLLVISESGRGTQQQVIWNCICDCGNKKKLATQSLKYTKSCGCLSKHYFNDHTGKIVNDLLIKKLVGKNKYNCWMYEIECNCGTIFVSEGNDIISSKIKSCGCRFNTSFVAKSEDEIKANSLWSAYKSSAKKRSIEFNLNPTQIADLCFKNCYYCNSGYTNKRYLRKYDYFIIYNGIDRIDNNKGYCIENCRTSCYNCNQAKHMMTETAFYEWINKVYTNLKGKNEENK